MSGGAQLDVRVSEVTTVARGIKRFVLASTSGATLPLFSAGSHVVVTMKAGARTLRNSYSLMGSPADGSNYQITVLLTQTSRGGSRFMHEAVGPGTELAISYPINLFPLDLRARKHVLLAGGIGITPLAAMAEQLDALQVPFELHYCVRDDAHGAYVSELSAQYDSRVCIYRTGSGGRPTFGSLLAQQPLGTHLYLCGPAGMIEAMCSGARSAGWPDENVHVERFLSPPEGQPFTLHLAKSGRRISVGGSESILEAVEAAGVDAPFLCRGGACGQCETAVLTADGQLLHNDHFLAPHERNAGNKIMICVSRFRGRELTVNL